MRINCQYTGVLVTIAWLLFPIWSAKSDESELYSVYANRTLLNELTIPKVEMEDVTLEEFCRFLKLQIEDYLQQTEERRLTIKFAFNQPKLKLERISISARVASVANLLDTTLKDVDLTYRITSTGVEIDRTLDTAALEDTAPKKKYTLASGVETEWPNQDELGASGAFWMSKRETARAMVKAGYGDEQSATRIARFWLHAIPSEPYSQWLVTSALLGNKASFENIAFSFEEEVASAELKLLFSRMKAIVERVDEIKGATE